MSCQIGVNQFFGASPYIKFLNSDIVAIDGPNTIQRLIGNIKIPYEQVLTGRIILKAGQVGYLMNHLGLGDNATFIAIIATYDLQSVNEEDNYLEYYYVDNTNTVRYMDQIMILTGNSTHRIPQLYFNNPNDTYNVTLDIMVANIDDTYTFFQNTPSQSGLSFYNLQCNATVNNIQTFVANESIVVYSNDTPPNPLVYLVLQDISSIHITGKIVVIDENTVGRLYLEFISITDAKQAFSLLNYVSNNSNITIQNLNPQIDIYPPVAYFYQTVGNTASGNYIEYNGATAQAYDTSFGLTFSTSLALGIYGSVSGIDLYITKTVLNQLLIATVSDNRDGVIITADSNFLLKNFSNSIVTSITSSGTYSLGFIISDFAGNSIDTNTKITLSIT
jgi:hypothetical protein